MEAAMDDDSRAPEADDAQSVPPPPEDQGGGDEVDVAAEEEEEDDDEEKESKLISELMDKITASPENPNPNVLHALSSILETKELLYIKETGPSSSNNTRGSHSIGRLGSLLQENDEFYELISEKYLSENGYSISVQAASARLLLCCSLSWMYPPVFEDNVLEKIKGWAMDDNARVSSEEGQWNHKHDLGKKKSSDSEMLKTYSTGLLAIALTSGGQLVEDVLTSGLSAKLMHYLRTRVLGETITSQRDVTYVASKNLSSVTSTKGREESRGRFRHVMEPTHIADLRAMEDGTLDDKSVEREHDRSISRLSCAETCLADGGEPTSVDEEVGIYDGGDDGEDRWHGQEICDVRMKIGETDETGRDDSSRRRTNRGWARLKGKGRVNEVSADNEMSLASPGLVVGRKEQQTPLKNLEMKRYPDAKKSSGKVNADDFFIEREDNDECFQECIVGSKDISYLVKKAVRAAEDEAKTADAPAEAIKAAGDAAAEVVKSAALEEFKSSGNEDAALLAASRAASTVIDAAIAVEVSRRLSQKNADAVDVKATEADIKEEVKEFFVLDTESLAELREKYCIRSLEALGEYVEVLGPVLHEKGVDVCLALLQRSSKLKEASKVTVLLPDILKLICALAAHRKFASLFVDRGGMQKLLAVPRVSHTFFGLSSCLFAIGSLQGIMERVCALSSDVVHRVVELALQLHECPEDGARKNAALFFNAAFVFRAILDCFDAQDGLRKLLSLLNDAASVRSGVNTGSLALSSSGSLRNDQSPAEVLTSSEKQIAYHTCVALRQYFRAHLLLLVDSIRPNKNSRSAARNLPTVRAPYKPLDISNEAVDAVIVQLQKDRKLGLAFVRARWPEVENFIRFNGHIIMLELCQAPPVERYLHDLLQYALGVLHIITLVPSTRKLIVNAPVSNDRVGIAVILDAANGGTLEPEIIQSALNVLVNLVCPPPSISNKPSQQSTSVQTTNGPPTETRDRNTGRAVSMTSQNEPREQNVELQTPVPTVASGLVGDRRICLGAGSGCAGLATQLEQGYCQAREAVRSNHGIKVLLHLLQLRTGTAVDCIRALACRVLLGLARDDTIAHMLTKLQVGKKLSELIGDPGSQTHGMEQSRWQAELAQAAIELIGIVTNSGRASTLAATDAAIPTLRRIERAAIAAATPITYHPRELLLLVHEHLQASGLASTAAALLKEAQLTPLPSQAGPSSSQVYHVMQESPSLPLQWPCNRAPSGFLQDNLKFNMKDKDSRVKCDSAVSSFKKKPLVFSPSLSFSSRSHLQFHDSNEPSSAKDLTTSKKVLESPASSTIKLNVETESQMKTPIIFPLKRKLMDSGHASSAKRIHTGEGSFRSPICPTPNTARKSSFPTDPIGFSTPSFMRGHDNLEDNNHYNNSNSHVGHQMTRSSFQLASDPLPINTERVTLDSLVVQYLKHQHRQCPAPITTLPPLSLLHPHVCPEPKQGLDAPSNVTPRIGTREFRSMYGGIHGIRKDRHFVYSRFRPWRTCRDDGSALLTSISFLGDSSQIAVGSRSGELKIFGSNSYNLLDSCSSHQSPVTLVQSRLCGERQLVLSSSPHDVHLWDALSVSGGPMHPFDGCKAARFSNDGTCFAAISSESSRREIFLYDIKTCQLDVKFTDTYTRNSGKGHGYSGIHFSPSDNVLLWNGVLWDRRGSGSIHRFDDLTDYGGGGFHPAGNEVIINSEVWDLRNFRLLQNVTSLDQTTITFNGQGDVIYAILRRNLDDITSAVHTRRVKHPLFSAFRTIDAVNYSDIATVPVDRCILDFATERTDSFLGLVTMDDQEELFSSARTYEIGRRRPTEDDSDPDDAESEEDEDEDDDEDGDVDSLLGPDIDGDDGDSDADDQSIDDDDDDSISGLDGDDDDDEDGDFIMNGINFGGGGALLEIVTDEDDDDIGSFSSDDEE